MEITFLGTGTSHGIPVIGCGCAVCTSADPRDNRLRSSIMIEANGKRIVVDTGPDFRQQMLREKVKTLDAVLFTHEHKDHTAGLDDIRSFNFYNDKDMDAFATTRVQENIRKSFDYIFSEKTYPGIPQIKFHTIWNEPFKIFDIDVIPVEVMHHKLPVLGFRFGDFCYITDAKTIPEKEQEKIYEIDTLVLNALRIEPHISHFSLSEAIDMALQVKAKNVYFTHIAHELGLHAEVDAKLPEGMHLAYDGLKLSF